MFHRWLLAPLICFSITLSPVWASDVWLLAREENGIKIYTRDFPGYSLKAQRGEMVIESTPDALVALMLDVAVCEKWVDRCDKNVLLRAPNHLPAQVYTVINMPWPFSSRDVAFEAQFVRHPESGVVDILIHDAGDLVELDPRYVRMPELVGNWRFTPLPHGRVRVEYHVRADPGGYLPVWVANIAAVGAAYRTLLRMRDMVRLPRYRDASPRVFDSPS